LVVEIFNADWMDVMNVMPTDAPAKRNIPQYLQKPSAHAATYLPAEVPDSAKNIDASV
jgi:hypothetical protein